MQMAVGTAKDNSVQWSLLNGGMRVLNSGMRDGRSTVIAKIPKTNMMNVGNGGNERNMTDPL